ncbi:MAG: hypothetical protein IKT46_02230 [Clostridia bacterium]|nr:hypothetical protein [Clostridia bacterium]
MKEKELKKLSRLELLELLLEANNENKILNERLSYLTAETEAAKSIERLAQTADRFDDMLEQTAKLLDSLKARKVESGSEKKLSANDEHNTKKDRTDRKLYVRIMSYYEKNDSALESLPEEIQTDIRNRLKEISLNRKNKG